MDLKPQQEQLNERLKPLFQRYFTCIYNLEQAYAVDREHEYACYETDMMDCVKAHDRVRRSRFAVARNRDKAFRQCTQTCGLYLPAEGVARTIEDLDDLHKYVDCMQPCLTSITSSMLSEIASIQQSTAELTAQFPLSS